MLAFSEHLQKPISTTETGAKSPETNVHIYDGAGELRSQLLNAPEWQQGEFILPKDSITVSMNADNVHGESIIELSNRVGKLAEKEAFAHVGIKDGYQKTGAFTSLSSIRRMARGGLDVGPKLGEPDRTVTLMYDAELRPGQDSVILPSAAMVHGELTPEQFTKLREQFPTVPFIDKNNELLDEVGRKERSEARAKYEQDMELGEAAVSKDLKMTEQIARMRANFAHTVNEARRGWQIADEATARWKGEQHQSSAPPKQGPKINKTNIPESTTPEAEKAPAGWDIAPDSSVDDIASQAINNLVPEGTVMTPDKLEKFSHKVKSALARKDIHPDIDARAQDVFDKVDKELMKRRNESRAKV